MSLWIINAILIQSFYDLISVDQIFKIARDMALLVALVLMVAAIWALGEKLVAHLRKRP